MSTTTSRRPEKEPEIRQPREPASSAKPTPPLPSSKPEKSVRKAKKGKSKLWWAVVVALLLVGVGGAAYYASVKFSGTDQQLVFFTVERGDLPIIVTERGTIESQENVRVLCSVDDIDGDSVRGTPIAWLVRNGASVKKDDLIVELEDSGHQERVDRQILAYEAANAAQIQAQAKFDNQITQNQTTEAEAELQVKLAELELKMYKDPAKGTLRLEVEEINRLIDDINSEIIAAEAALELAKKDKEASEELFKLGYAGKKELDQSRLALLTAESKYATQMNKLQTQLATLNKKNSYEREMQILTLDGKVATAKRALEQIKRDNKALMDQAKAELDNANGQLKKETERLTRYKEHLKNCKIYAPTDGMVAYAVGESRRWWEEEIREGATVRPRQHLLSIPNLSKMQVRTTVHESVIDQVREGLPATIRIEAFPELAFKGSVKSVAVLAEQKSPETKVYQTIVAIEGEVDQLKPDMTAIVEIHVDRIENVLTVPVQAIVQEGSKTWCYVGANNEVERRDITLGATNHKFVEIKSGLNEGDRVVLNPMAILEESEKEEKKEESQEPEVPEVEPEQSPPPAPTKSPSGASGGGGRGGSFGKKKKG